MSLATTRTMSQHLQDLIDAANRTTETLGQQIIEIYETAKKEGFTPMEARALITVKVIKVSDRYIRRILPDEAKETKYSNKFDTEDLVDDDDDSEAELVPPTTAATDKPPKIPESKYEIKDAQSEELHDLPEPQEEESDIQTAKYDPQEINTRIGKENIQLKDQVEKLTKENTELRMKQVGTLGNKFDFEYDYEMPSGDIVPFIVTCFPDKKDGYIRLNKTKIEENERKEAKRK